MRGGRHLDEFQPSVVIPCAEIYSADASVVGFEDLDVVFADQRRKKTDLLLVIPGPVGLFDEGAMRALVEIEKPGVIGGGGLPHGDLHTECSHSVAIRRGRRTGSKWNVYWAPARAVQLMR